MNVIDWPLSFLRDYTVPPAGEEAWDKQRSIIVPFTMVLAFMYLFGMLSDLSSEDEAAKKSAD